MTIIYDSERITPSLPVTHIAHKNYDRDAISNEAKGKLDVKTDSDVQVWGFTTSGVNLDVTSYDLYDFGRVRTTLALTPDEARKMAVELMTAAALVENRSV